MIAYFVYKLDSYSGAAAQALLLAKSMKKNILIFNHNNKSYKKYRYNDFIDIVDLPQNKLLQLFIIFFTTLKYKIKIFHFHGSFTVGLVIGNLLNKKMILKTTLLGDDDFDTFSTKKSWKIRYFLLKKIYKNIVLSNKLKEINSKYIEVSKIELIPNGVFLADSCPALNEKENSFCFVGLVCKRKRTYESIKYFIANYSSDTTTKMYIVGPYKDMKDNNEFSNSYVEKCFKLIKDNSLEDRISFTGLMSKEKTQDILKKSKALLFFSSKEGMPNVVLEAMANNCIPITSELDGVIREIFEDKKQGFILDDSFQSIKASDINDMISIKETFMLMQNKFSIGIVGDRYREIYEK